MLNYTEIGRKIAKFSHRSTTKGRIVCLEKHLQSTQNCKFVQWTMDFYEKDAFGRKQFLLNFAVFSSPQTHRCPRAWSYRQRCHKCWSIDQPKKRVLLISCWPFGQQCCAKNVFNSSGENQYNPPEYICQNSKFVQITL